MDRPTGIIRTLPNLYAGSNEKAYKRMLMSFEWLASGHIPAIYVAMAQKPTLEVLHIYLLIDGKIICRMNIAGYEDGATSDVKCWDEVSRTPKWWALCTLPIVFPPEPVFRRGFQGFRYCEDLF
jgi:hypothetical protein